MTTEIEARLLNCDVKAFVLKLKENGAKFVGDWLQMRNLYDFNPVRSNSWIRLRTNGIETTLTIKEVQTSKIDGTKECEIVVSDFNTTDELLNKLGYFARGKQENRRIRFMLDDVEIDIDLWPVIPPYVEFEAKSEKQIRNVCKKLNIEYGKLTTMDVGSIYASYGHEVASLPAVLLLEDEKKNLKV